MITALGVRVAGVSYALYRVPSLYSRLQNYSRLVMAEAFSAD